MSKLIEKVDVIFQITKRVEIVYESNEFENALEAFDDLESGPPELYKFNERIAPELEKDGWEIEIWDTETVDDAENKDSPQEVAL